jgi:light-regulated signal transduction histidine kinase (bacteriophytochrome)
VTDTDVLAAYSKALADYVAGAGEEALAKAYEVGREALVGGVSVTELAIVHHRALLGVLPSHPAERTVARAGELLSEMLAPFEMTQRGYREAYGALASLNAELVERNEALERAARVLAESQRETQLVNEELEGFSYSVAHDLRAPLRAIDGFSQALAEDGEGQLDEESLTHLSQIRTATKRMGQLIDDLLRLSRIGRSELRREKCDLTEVARGVCGALARGQGDRRVDWEVQDGMEGEADLALMRIAFENLLGNAWKFTARKAAATVRCTAELVDQHVVYRIQDNGAGFDPAHATRLFSPFQRLHASKDFEGNGIGLAIVQRVIRRHGGDIWAEGRPDEGATFHFTLDWQRL